MLDGLAIHVAKIKRPIRAIRCKYRTTPVVRRCEEFRPFPATSSVIGRAITREYGAVNYVAGGVAGKSVVVIFRRQRRAPVNGKSASRRKSPRMGVGRSRGIGEGKEPGLTPLPRNFVFHLVKPGVRITCQVGLLQEDLGNVLSVGTDKTVPITVEGLAELCLTCRNFQVTGIGIIAKIAGPHLQRGGLWVPGIDDLTPTQSIGEIKPIVQAQCRVTHIELGRTTQFEAGEEILPNVRHIIAVCIL